jgi:copper chaperone CopZ
VEIMETIHIKNMVCPRCIKSIKGILKELDVDFNSIELGRIELGEPLKDDIKSA